MKITHWTIKITQEDGTEEYLSDKLDPKDFYIIDK